VKKLILVVGLPVLVLIAAEVWVSLDYARTSAAVLNELRQLRDPNVERLRQQAAALRIDNERRSLFVTTFVANIGATIGVLLTIFGAWFSVQQFLGARTRERLDRAASELNEIWKGLMSDQAETRAASVASLRQFISPDKAEYHGRVASALAICGRTDDAAVSRTLVPVVEDAFHELDHATISKVSWRGIRLPNVNLDGVDLSHVDLREAVLEGAVLVRCNLSGARLDGALLNDVDGTEITAQRTSFAGASLRNARFARSSMQGADLRKTDLLFTDLDRTNLTGALLPTDHSALRISRNWRNAVLDEDIRRTMIDRYGDVTGGPRILMVTWEYPPYVTGGGWTAAYNFISEMRLLGREITLIVPWSTNALDHSIFGGDVEVIGTGAEEGRPRGEREFYYSGYSGYSAGFQRFKADIDEELLGAYLAPTRSVLRLVSDFRIRARETVRQRKIAFDVVHAHDWLALEAAMPIAFDAGKPLVAHLHSTETDRQKEPSRRIAAVENAGCKAAAEIIVPSRKLAATVRKACSVPADRRIHVIPNPPSPADSPSRGQFGTDRVIFLGRLTWQKAPDVFVEIANRVRESVETSEFIMFGDGDELRSTAELIDRLRPIKPVVSRPRRSSYGTNELTMEFDRIRQVDFDATTHSISPRSSPLVSAPPRSFLYEVGDHDISVVPLQGFKHFTHHLSYADRHYLIATNLLPGYAASPERFVVLGGTLPWHQRYLALDEATVLVVPSRSEPFGMVILEAMQSGVPVVCTDRAGALEWVTPAAVFDPANVEPTAASIVKLLTDEPTWINAVESQRASFERYLASADWRKLDAVWKQSDPSSCQ
jgi:glycosyltransferase involved in cell wall biosynthesis/uncharacterized protein YjbI with pentapeptide repeats